jgi:hypothetical protein
MQAPLVIIYEHGSSYVHGITQEKSFLYPASLKTGLHLGGYVDEFPPYLDVEPEFFPMGLHDIPPV